MLKRRCLRKNVERNFINYISNVPYLKIILRKMYRELFSYLKVVGLHINTECNYNCKYCYIDKNTKILPIDEWIKVIDESEKLKVTNINFIGGEPFLHKDFSYLLHYTAKKGFHIGIFTNGSLIDDEWIREIKNLPTKVFLAIKYDYNSDTYEKHTGRGYLFSKVQDVIKKSTQAGIKVIAFINLTKYNIEYVEEMIESSIKLGAYPVLERYVPVNSEEINEEFEVDPEKYSKAMKLVKNAYRRVERIIENKTFIQGNFHPCFINQISVTPDGFALPCPLAPLDFNFGNVKKVCLEEIWNKYKQQRKRWTLPTECKDCPYKYVCGGGCRVHAYLKYKDINRKDPLCKGFPPVYGECGWCVVSYPFKKVFGNIG